VKCTQCGVELSAFDVVCPACGTPQQHVPAANVTSSPKSYDEAQPPMRPPPARVGSLAMWILIVIVLVVAGGIYEATMKTIATIQPANLTGDQAARIAQLQRGESECDAMLSMVNQGTQQLSAQDFKDATGDMNQANIMLEQCQAETSADDAANVRNCTNWLGTDRMYEQQWSDAQP
jgi:hypothetical protein